MACCCGPTSGGTSALPILTGAGQPTTPPDLSTHLPLYRDITTGQLWAWAGGVWAVTRAPIDWMISALAPTPLQDTDFITINRGGTPGNPDSGTYYVTTIQDLADAVAALISHTIVSSGSPVLTVTQTAPLAFEIDFDAAAAAAAIAADPTYVRVILGAGSLNDLSDVNAPAPAVGDHLVWSGTEWRAEANNAATLLTGVCASCLTDALNAGLQPGQYFLDESTTPPRLFHWDGSNLTAVDPLPELFLCCNSNRLLVNCDGNLVDATSVEVANQVVVAVCAVDEASALAAGVGEGDYWLDVSATPPVLYVRECATFVPVTFTPKVVFCSNSGAIFVNDGSALVEVRSAAVFYVRTLSELQALDTSAMQSGAVVFMAGRNVPGDGGGGHFVWDPSDRSADHARDPLMGLFVPPAGQDGSQGIWVRQYTGSASVLWFGVDRAGTTDASAAITSALALTRDVYVPAGVYLIETGAHLPSYTTSSASWDELNPAILRGAGMNHTLFKIRVPNGYGVSHPTIGATFRGQNGPGVMIEGITFEGPGWTYESTAIGLDNCRKPIIRECAFRRFPLGVGIHLYSESSGGMFQPHVEKCYFGLPRNQYVAPVKFYNKSDIEWGVRVGVWLNGPTDNRGKITDAIINGNMFFNVAVGVLVKGHGATFANGGAANVTIEQNTFGAEGYNKIEDNTLSNSISDTQVVLNTAAGFYPTDWGTDYVGFVIRILINGEWEARTITAYDPATRTVTVGTPFSAVPDPNAQYRISYFDSYLATFLQPHQAPVHIVLEHGTFHHRLGFNRSEEAGTHLVLIRHGLRPIVASIGNSWRIQEGAYAEYEDGTEAIIPTSLDLTATNYGWYAAMPSLRLGHPANMFKTLFMQMKRNATGGPVSTGDVVSLSTTSMQEISSLVPGRLPLVVGEDAYGPDTWQNGEIVPIALPGTYMYVKIPAASGITSVAPNDVLYVNASGQIAVDSTGARRKRMFAIVVDFANDGGTGGDWFAPVLITMG